MKSILIRNDDIAKGLSIPVATFPKYTTQLINLANQNAQGTRPKVVGQMSDLIQEFKGRTLAEWSLWYSGRMPGGIERATKRVLEMVQALRSAIELIDEPMVNSWVTDLVINKTYTGLRFQDAILRHLASLRGEPYRLATPEEEAKGIDGYLGKKPVSIKPTTYESKQMLPESIGAELIYYEKKKEGVKVSFRD
jgi:hypothetical protein